MHSTEFQLDFKDTEVAFSSKSDQELKSMSKLFSIMNKAWLVKLGAPIGLAAFKYNLPFTESIVLNTIFPQFCGGRTLLECEPSIQELANFNIFTVLDYGAEGKETEKDFNLTMNETTRAIDFAYTNDYISVISTKLSGLTQNRLLEKLSRNAALSTKEEHEYESLMKRIDVICNRAEEKNVCIFIDAEESWLQPAIDQIVDKMMSRYNTRSAIIYNTFQMYRHDRLDFLKKSHQKASKGNYILGAKLVRGAYMDKERQRALEKGVPSPINKDKASTDKNYNSALEYCVANYEEIASSNSSHNEYSNLLQAELIQKQGIPKNHPHLHFCQLYGMSDNITFNLAKAGYHVAKYMPYGPVRDVIPYLIRRTQENTAVTGDMSREYKLIQEEIRRRGI